MAYEIPGLTITLTAGADFSSSQYKFVELSADNTVTICNAATDKAIGVLQNAPASGGAACIMVQGVTKVQGDADLGYGDLVGTSADGQAAAYTATDTTKHIVGIVLQGNSAAAGLATVLLFGGCGRTLA